MTRNLYLARQNGRVKRYLELLRAAFDRAAPGDNDLAPEYWEQLHAELHEQLWERSREKKQ